MIVPPTRTKFGDRAYSVGGPTVTVWNSLPPESVRSAETLASVQHFVLTGFYHLLTL